MQLLSSCCHGPPDEETSPVRAVKKLAQDPRDSKGKAGAGTQAVGLGPGVIGASSETTGPHGVLLETAQLNDLSIFVFLNNSNVSDFSSSCFTFRLMLEVTELGRSSLKTAFLLQSLVW